MQVENELRGRPEGSRRQETGFMWVVRLEGEGRDEGVGRLGDGKSSEGRFEAAAMTEMRVAIERMTWSIFMGSKEINLRL